MPARQHPDHEFLYEVGVTPDGRPIYTSDVFMAATTNVDTPGMETELGLFDRIRIPSHNSGSGSR
jgi:hypothetical protein